MNMIGQREFDAPNDVDQEAIAIVGMAGRFPGAGSIEAYWRNLLDGVESISRLRGEDLRDSFTTETRGSAAFVAARPILDRVDMFDAAFFGMYPREAALTDPQHRVFLECAWEALESAGYDPAAYEGRIGIFAGCSLNTYLLHHLCADRAFIEDFTSSFQLGNYPTLLGAGQDFLTTRVAYKLDLRGPAMTLGTACSTSLSAVAQSCLSLQAHQADMMLAGGVSISFPQERGYLHQKGGMASADGHCRPFDGDASGTVFGSGAAVVVLKRLSDAVADRDTIHAVIRSSAMNNDGARKIGFTAPSVEGQFDVICDAHRRAGIDARSIGYVECHGTATPLGDPIEFAALDRAFRTSTDDRGFCALGSAKANIGHLDAAAGVAGLIKAVLAVRDGIIPPLGHFVKANPLLDVAASPFTLGGEARAWPEAATPRRAGVSALGVGGTNVHVVVEQAITSSAAMSSEPAVRPFILPIAARSASALRQSASALAACLADDETLDLGDVAHTLQIGRRHFDERTAVVCRSRKEAIEHLRKPLATSVCAKGPDLPVIFMIPGQGAQYHGMGRDLYRGEPVFRAIVDDGAQILKPHLGRDLRDVLFGDVASDPDLAAAINATQFAQPSLFLISYATARLVNSWGIEPAAMIGHSIGELVCATLSGVISFKDAIRFVAERGRLMQEMPPGTMVAVRLPEKDLVAVLPPTLAIAAVNGPRSCVVSGPAEAADAFTRQMAERDVACRPLRTSHAFHSSMMDPVAEALASWLSRISFGTPTIPYVSAVTGDWVDAEIAGSADYWARHCRECVRFSTALARAVGEDKAILLEVGPGRTLTSFAAQTLSKGVVAASLTSLPGDSGGGDEQATIMTALASLWSVGCRPDWDAVNGTRHRRIPLPTYPFERERHWIEPPPPTVGQAASAPSESAAVPKAEPVAEALATRAVPAKTARVKTRIIQILEDLSGDTVQDGSEAVSFLDLGFDSLFLAQLSTKVQSSFDVAVTFRQLLDDLSSIDALSTYVAAQRPEEPDQGETALPETSDGAAVSLSEPQVDETGPGSTSVHALLHQQLVTMQALFAQQLQVLSQAAPGHAAPTSPAVGPVAKPAPLASRLPGAFDEVPSRFQVYQGAKSAPAGPITPRQRRYIDELTNAYSARAEGSKRATQAHRAVLADPRAAAGFRRDWKDMVFPIVCARSKGSKIWDVDGNEYVDLVNGYGQTAFGHAPDFVIDAVADQLRSGFAIGPQSPLTGEVAALIHQMTGNERVTFCNTGSEAVMAAMRIARNVTGRSKVVVFEGAYHGQFDEVLVKGGGRNAAAGALPAAGGIPDGSVGNMVVLPYGTDESLNWIRGNASGLAAVIVEPVQSRRPAFLPSTFLSELRRITESTGTALVFDEVVTGFRVHPGGMQAVLGIRADLATYGKVVGGGMPIGILAGAARFMDALDGGFWRYGDTSFPETAPTFFAGTFVRHPVALAAARAVLRHLLDEGPELQGRLAARTAAFVDRFNAELVARGLESRAETFSSWFIFSPAHEDRLASLFFHEARLRGVHVQEGFPCFLTTAHSEADVERILDVFKQSLDALQNGGILLGDAKSAESSISGPVALADAVPWTEPQREIWLTAQLGDDASCAFNESVSLDFVGDLDVPALESALDDVVARHDSLRARFDPDDATMRVVAHAPASLPRVDAGSSGDAAGTLAVLLDAEARTPFDLVEGPLFRTTLVAMAGDRHTLVLTAHHIICDGWSVNVILDELGSCYAARRKGKAATLPEASEFRRYAIEAARPNDDRAKAEAFWRGQFVTLPVALDLPSDRPRPARKSFRGATHSGSIEATLTHDVKTAGARLGCTLFATLLAAFQLVVARLSGESDIVIAVPTSGQASVGASSLVGHCVNLLPLRAGLAMNGSVADHLRATRGRVLDAFEHQDFTYGTLVRTLGIPRDQSRLPLTQIQFNLEKLSSGSGLPGVTMTSTPNAKAFCNFDLFANFIESADGLRIDCDYNTDLFDASNIERWIGHLREVLKAIVADVSQPLSAVPMMSANACRALIEGANATTAADLDLRPVHRLVAEQAEKTPDAVAVAWRDIKLSYAELDAQSSRLAHRVAALVRHGGARVGLATSRSPGMLVALFAILKAGCAYVPLDLSQPDVRLQAIVEDAQVSAIICDDEAVSSRFTACPVIDLDASEASVRVDSAPSTPLEVDQDAERTAYVIFTSGSTGRPKGVAVAHRSLTNLLRSMQRRPGFTARDTLLAVTTIGFDIAGAELLLPLIVGGCVVIADREEVTAGFPLVERIRTANATMVQATPSLWRILSESGFRSHPGLTMISGGEPLPRDLADTLLEGGGALWNAYGPTETTIWSSLDPVTPGSGPITIEHPVLNTQLYVLDDQHCLTPIGVPGDLFIGGEGLARGYFGRQDLTDAAFRLITLPGRTPQRLYRTGDVAKRLAGGAIQLLGRKDAQIKLRGFRIELEDIEAVLRRAEGVGAVAASLRVSPEGESKLVAYVVPSSTTAPASSALATYAVANLPDYMVPRQWVSLAALPLTPNGKLDRRALPEPTAIPAASTSTPAAPLTALQARLAQIVREVLRIGSFGIDDSIFALGADSLHVFRIAARMRAEALGLDARDLLLNPTIRDLAVAAAAAQDSAGDAAPALQAFRRRPLKANGVPA